LLKKQKEVIEFAPHETVSNDTSSSRRLAAMAGTAGQTDIIDLS